MIPRILILLLALGLLASCSGADYDDDDDSGSDDDDDDTADDDDDDTADDDDDDTADDDDDTTPPAGAAWEYMYAQTSTDLFSVDKDSPHTVTWVGTFSQERITDLAVDIDGRMYGVTDDEVFEVDPLTGDLTSVAYREDTWFVALTALADGTMLAGSDDEIYEIDVLNGSITYYDSLGDWEFAGDMVGLPDGLLYCLCWPTDHWAESTSLVVYDPGTGVATEIGPTNHGAMYGMGLADWVMFGFNTDGEILDIDRTTGAATVVAEPGHEFWGAATNPLRWD
jgi:hypothetical protein